MQQRRLRLGDILDDYCPRERRITNHAVVAMIDDEVKQTRCTTCDADHEYKQAKVPPQRRKRGGAGASDTAEGAGRLRPAEDEAGAPDETVISGSEGSELHESESAELPEPFDAAESPADASPAEEQPPAPVSAEDEGPVHRRLIRATLPRPDGQAPERKDPEFTIRQPGMRGPGGKRGRHQRSTRPPSGAPSRFGGPRHGSGQGPRHAGGGPGHGHRPAGNRSGPHHGGGPRGNRQGPGGGRGGRKRGR
jgi:hypothetical protein